MIVDFHSHIIDYSWLPERWWAWLIEFTNSRRQNSLLSRVTADDLQAQLCDREGSKLLAAMEDAQIDKSIVLPLDWGILFGEPLVPIEEQHDRIAEIAEKSNGKIVPFVGVDPRRKGALELIRYCLEDRRMQGIKLYPAAGYDPTDEAYHGIFEAALRYSVPVLLHTGYSFGQFSSEHCGPGMLDCLCARYPDVTFVAAHLGSGYLEQLCWLGYAKPNLYADCSLMQIRARQNHSEFAGNLRLACDLFGSRRILFGTDWPFAQSVMRNDEYVSAFGKLKSDDSPGGTFAGYEVKQILGGTAASLLSKKKGGCDVESGPRTK